MRAGMSWVAGLVSVLLFAAGCEGELLPPQGAACFEDPVPSAVFRRLSNEQYIQTVRDIMGDPEMDVDLGEDGTLEFSLLDIEKINSGVELIAEARPSGLMALLPCDPDGPVDRMCAASFVQHLAMVAFRRPLHDSERDLLLASYDANVGDLGFADALRLVVEIILQSPQMLYVHEIGVADDATPGGPLRLTGFERATRLALLLWDAGPDAALLERAERGDLDTAEGVGEVTRALLREDRARVRIRDQIVAMLELDGGEAHASLADTPKDEGRFGEVTEVERKAMREEVEAFVQWAIFDSGDGFRALFTSRRAYVNATLAARYGVAAPTEAEWHWVDLPQDQRAGLLTRLAFLATHAHADFQSPILRGAFIRDRFFCEGVGPPPPNVDDTPVGNGDSTGETRGVRSIRELTTIRTGEGTCPQCHQLFNPIGFALGHYDAMGQWQLEEEHQNEMGGVASVPVNALGGVPGTDVEGELYGGVELSERMAESRLVQGCITRRWLRIGVSSARVRHDSCLTRALQERLNNSGDLLEVIVGITQSSLFLTVAAPEGGES